MGHRKKGKSHKKSQKDFESPVKAKKYLGQHFLKDEAIAQKIAQTLSLEGYDEVLEIGPGTGVLTKYLLLRGMQLTAMDLDGESITYLKENFQLEHHKVFQKGALKIVEANFLKFDLSTLFNGQQFAITGNFPYNISTQIVFKMLELRHQIPEFSGMFQKEVAQRICEKEGSKTYGILSVLTQAFYDVDYLFTVHPQVFEPPPKVQSGVILLKRKPNFHLHCDEKLLFRIVKLAFNQRRKTIRNSLKTLNLSDNLREDAIFDRRPEQLSVADFIALAKRIANDTL